MKWVIWDKICVLKLLQNFSWVVSGSILLGCAPMFLDKKGCLLDQLRISSPSVSNWLMKSCWTRTWPKSPLVPCESMLWSNICVLQTSSKLVLSCFCLYPPGIRVFWACLKGVCELFGAIWSYFEAILRLFWGYFEAVLKLFWRNRPKWANMRKRCF